MTKSDKSNQGYERDIMQKAIVTGASGFIGKELITELLNKGVEVYAVINKNKLDTKIIQSDKLHVIQCDLNKNAPELEVLKNAEIDVFYHFAWKDSYGIGRCDLDIQIENVKMGISCFNIAEKIGCKKFIGIGTISEFLILDREPYGKQIKAGNQIYAIAKDYLHTMLRVVSYGKDIEVIWCRLSNIYGSDLSISNLISYEIKTIMQNLVPKFSDALQPYNFIYVKDCIKALFAVGEGKCKHTEYFIGGKESNRLDWYLKMVQKQFPDCKKIGIGERENDGLLYSEQWFDISDLKNDFNFVPDYGFEEGIREAIGIIREKSNFE